jgi:hypothetical protein
MALPIHALNVLKPYLAGDVLSLGYPDIDATSADMERVFGYKPTKFTTANEWHGVKDKFPDSEELFQHLGVNLTVVDYTQDRGIEKIADLNEPHDLGKFDLVIDPGTLEHCFNIGQAVMNAANAVKVGGHIFHISPMTMMNHGFYNLCPTFFYDFYAQNGWVLDGLAVLPNSQMNVKVTDRFFTQTEFVLRCLARRKIDGVLKFPIQTKYLKRAKR